MSESSPRERSDHSVLKDAGAAIKRESRELAGEARSAAYRAACEQRDALAGFVSALAEAANSSAESLENSGYGRSAAAVRRTAGEVGGLAERFQRRDPDELWADVEDFARDHPVVLFGASFALAFGLTRFLKSGTAEQALEAAEPASATAVATPAGE